MTFNELFVYRKLNKIKEYLEELNDVLKLSDKEILKSSVQIHAVERLFQLVVDEVLDINQHFIGELNLKLTEDFQGTFDTLSDNEIISKKFANKVSGLVNLRNIIVHAYESLDKKLFLKNLRENYYDFEEYIKFINDYLDKEF